MKNLLVDVANGVMSIESEIDAAMATLVLEPEMSLFQALYKSSADCACDSNLNHFFDTLMDRYFLPDSTLEEDYPHHVSCFLAAVCLSDADTFVKFVIDVYGDKNDGSDITLNDCRVLLLDIFSNSAASARVADETLMDISQYASSIAETSSIFHSPNASASSSSSAGTTITRTESGNHHVLNNDDPFRKTVVEHFFVRKRKKGLWPLEVFQNQIRMKFLGINYWNQLSSNPMLVELGLVSASFDTIKSFAMAIKHAVEEVKDHKYALVTHEAASGSDIIEQEGIFVCRPRRARTKKRVSGNSQLKKSMLLSIATEYEDRGDTDKFVTPQDADQHRRRHSPTGSSRHSSRASSPVQLSATQHLHLAGGIATHSTESSPVGEHSPSTVPSFSTGGVAGMASAYHHQPQPSYSQTYSPSGSPVTVPRSTSLFPGNFPESSPTLTASLSTAMAHLHGLNILVIEDSVFQRKVMAKRLNTVRRKAGTPDSENSSVTSAGGGSLASSNSAPAILGTSQYEGSGNSLLSAGGKGSGAHLSGKPPLPSPKQTKVSGSSDSSISLTGSNTSASASTANTATTANTANTAAGSLKDGESNTSSDHHTDLVRSVPVRRPSWNTAWQTGSDSADAGDPHETSEWNVTEACNGEEAIRMIISAHESFDVIFVDENLQSSGGYLLGHEVVRILRNHRSVPSSVIIIGCSSNAEKYAQSFLEAGADAMWKKPLPSDNMIVSELCKYLAWRG